MVERQARLELRIDPGDAVDAEELAELTQQLRQNLLEFDVLAVEPASSGEATAGSKGVDVQAAGSLVVGLTGSGNLLRKIIDAVQGWISRRGPRSVRLELDGDVLEFTGVSPREQRELINLWIDRHESSDRVDAGRRALIVASHEYQDPGLRRLRAPAHNAEVLARVLRNSEIGGFDVQALINKPTHAVRE